ncbi:DMT family transporter [Nocardioides sp. R-C-SC26]|uniref:DMT family transporter n=1 Tax=Nocardioides sp. R-C-SC26 TaxID=2870414 RepID=UPI001E37895E|nr:DMT family transporter [Nocardioides sp. R-C-SC26]
MTTKDSAIAPPSAALLDRTGLWWGLLGVTAFSFTVPLTRVAVESLSPLFIGTGRAVVAAMLAGAALCATRQRPPIRHQWWRLAKVSGGVVLGFPLLTSYALTSAPAGHSAVVIGLLPAATAVVAVWLSRERPQGSFWTFAVLGAVSAVGFASVGNGGVGQLSWADALLFAAVVAAAVGYAEGALLARELGAWQTVSWALVLASPVTTALALGSALHETPSAAPHEWLAFAYLAAVSMFLGFFAWYRGLAIGPIAQVSQVQLTQPVLTIVWAALLLGERVTLATALGGIAVIACAALAVRTRQRQAPTAAAGSASGLSAPPAEAAPPPARGATR